MLIKIKPQDWTPYVNKPEATDDTVIFRSIAEPIAGLLPYGVGRVFPLPEYSPGDTLQWAILARSPTAPTTLRIQMMNTLAYAWLTIQRYWTWQRTPPVVVDSYVDSVYLALGEPNKEVEMKTLALGDPDSIRALVSPVVWPWVVGGVAVGALGLAALVALSKRESGR